MLDEQSEKQIIKDNEDINQYFKDPSSSDEDDYTF